MSNLLQAAQYYVCNYQHKGCDNSLILEYQLVCPVRYARSIYVHIHYVCVCVFPYSLISVCAFYHVRPYVCVRLPAFVCTCLQARARDVADGAPPIAGHVTKHLVPRKQKNK